MKRRRRRRDDPLDVQLELRAAEKRGDRMTPLKDEDRATIGWAAAANSRDDFPDGVARIRCETRVSATAQVETGLTSHLCDAAMNPRWISMFSALRRIARTSSAICF